MQDTYKKLREKIDGHPMGAPEHPSITSILKELFRPEEARLALSMSFKPLEASEIAGRGNVTSDDAYSLLESMADKGIIYCVKSRGLKRYALMPPMPGFFEFPLMTGEETPRNMRLGRLWEEYFTGALGKAMHDTKVPMSRVVPVNKGVDHGVEVFPHEEAVEIVKSARNIALAQCQCRFSARNCDAPLDVCLLLDNWADFLTDRGLAKPITLQEAMDALQWAEEAGLVHMTTNTRTPVPYICNCCSCCCFMLRGVTELGRNSLASSRFIAVVAEDACVGCGECIKVCGFKAIEIVDGDVARVIKENCLGCGLCASVCPGDVITMETRSDSFEPYNTGAELIMDIARDKGKLDSFTSS